MTSAGRDDDRLRAWLGALGSLVTQDAAWVGPLPIAAAARSAPDRPGLFLVVRADPRPPRFLELSPAGRFKGRDPSVAVDELESRWNSRAAVLYVGSGGSLRQRLHALAAFGGGKPVGHWGGRLIWQLADADALTVVWFEVPETDVDGAKATLLQELRRVYGRQPFANVR